MQIHGWGFSCSNSALMVIQIRLFISCILISGFFMFMRVQNFQNIEDVTWVTRNLLALRNHVILIYYNREGVESSIDRARTTLRHQAAGVSGSWSDTCRFRRRQFWGVPHSSDLGPATDSCLLSLEVGTFGLSSSSLWLVGRLGQAHKLLPLVIEG